MSGVEDTVLRLCVWYKSGSIVSNNDMYVQCHQSCSGFTKGCQYYLSKKEYFKAQLETCKRINTKTEEKKLI